MDRLIIIGKNSQFPRLGARSAPNRSLPDYGAGLFSPSGTQPDAAAGGPRQAARPSSSSMPPVHELEGQVSPQ